MVYVLDGFILPRVRRAFKERMSLPLRVTSCACLGILREYDKKARLSKNLLYAVIILVDIAINFSKAGREDSARSDLSSSL
jgi:hypothetical protein